MKTLYILGIFMLCPLLLLAQTGQQPPVTIKAERNSSQEIVFTVENLSFVPYTITLTFDKLQGTNTLTEGIAYNYPIYTGRKNMVTLRPTDPNSGISYSYRSLIRKGNWEVKPDSNFVYLFPLADGKPVRMSGIKDLKDSHAKVVRYIGISFKTTEGDTIFAARSGEVGEILDVSASTGDHKAYSKEENYIEIFHKDGSWATYRILKDGGILVKPGDRVIAGQPIGIAGGKNYENGSHLMFVVHTPNRDDSFFPTFYLSDGQTGKPNLKALYVSTHPKEIIMQEMTKKEKKIYFSL